MNGELDIAANSNRSGLRFTGNPNSTNHEAQVTWQVGPTPANDGVGGPAVRMRTDATTQWYYVEYHMSSASLILKRKNADGSATTVATHSLTVPAGAFVTVRLAANGNDLSRWWQIHGATKPSDPGWIGNDAVPNYTVTDATYNTAAHSHTGIAGHWGGIDYDTRHDYFKARAR